MDGYMTGYFAWSLDETLVVDRINTLQIVLIFS